MTAEVWSFFVVAYYLYLVVTIIYLVLDNRETSATFAWLFVLVAFPFFGLVLYLLIGRNRRRSHKHSSYQQYVNRSLNICLKEHLNKKKQHLKDLFDREEFSSWRKLFELLSRNSNSVLMTRNSIRIFYCGKDKFDQLIADLQKARTSIHMEYFIWRSDALTETIKELLIEKSKAGVEVRILYDVIGSLLLSRRYIRELRGHGVKIYPYDNLSSVISLHSLNYRDHRKIVVIDGKIAYTGGMNMGQEYITGGPRFATWRDTHVRVVGEAVLSFQAIFMASWFNTTQEELLGERYFPTVKKDLPYLPVQITTSGPDSEWSSIEQLYFDLITSAQESICIQSPYFIPNESVYKALLGAALGGIDVKIMVAGKADKWMPFWAAFSFFEPLLKAGVRIYHYQTGFMHAKTIVVDQKVSSVGTANMDIRSFQLNYEVNMLMYDKPIAEELDLQFTNDLSSCDELTLEEYYQLGTFRNFRNSIARLFAPLM